MGRKLRILHLANQAGPLNLFMLPACDMLKKAGYEVELACMAGGPLWSGLKESGYPLHGLTRGGWGCPVTWWRTYRQVRALLRDRRFDMMIVHTPAMSWIARYAARGLVNKVVYMAHGLPFTSRQSWLVRNLFRYIEVLAGRYTDAILVMNRADEQACKQFHLARADGGGGRIPGVGVDVSLFEKPLEGRVRRKLDEQFRLRGDKPMLLYLGRFIPAKRPCDILALARKLGDSVDILMAGEGPLWETVREKAREIGPHVHVRGWTDRCVDLVRRSTIAVFPSVFAGGRCGGKACRRIRCPGQPGRY
jgi:glycosyltransferase involved in cell wall biosynthesis